MALLGNPYPVANGVQERATPDPRVLAHAIDARESVYRVIVVKDLGDGVAEVSKGTGFAIRAEEDKCLILTCNHVLRGELEERDFDGSTDRIFVRKMCYTGNLRVRDYTARVLHRDEITDLAVIEATGLTEVIPLRFDSSTFVLGRTTIVVGYCDVPLHGFTRTPTVSPGITTSHPQLSREGTRKRVQVNISCAGTQGSSGSPAVSLGGVIGVVATGVKVRKGGMCTEHYIEAISTSTIHVVMKMWRRLPANDPRTIHQVISML